MPKKNSAPHEGQPNDGCTRTRKLVKVIRVLLINQEKIPHYRVPVYGYLSGYLHRYGFELIIVSAGIQSGNSLPIEFEYSEMTLSAWKLIRFICRKRIDIIIFWVNLKHLYMFPVQLIAKFVLRKKTIYWGHGRDLAYRGARLKNLAYGIQQAFSDSIILYAEHLKKYIPSLFHKKVFIANNTLYLDYKGLPVGARGNVLTEYGIHTKKKIICVGRIQKRKRLEHLVEAFSYINQPDIGLILVGPDPSGILNNVEGDRIYKLSPIYGKKKFDLLSAADVYCLPGAVGLSIIDAFYCGLPFVTEDGDESPEIMYLKNGVNGFVVPNGNILDLAQKLQILLENDTLRKQFSKAAKKEIAENASIDKLCDGFREALFHAVGQTG